jgi:hypothetical protein
MNWSDLAQSLGLARDATSTHILNELCERLGTAPVEAPSGLLSAPDDPQGEFHRLAERTSKVLGISLADAYSRVSNEAPTLYERATAKARLN